MLATLVIGLREGLEAALIVGIIAAFLRKNGKSLVPMWIGVAIAVALSILVGVGLSLVEQALPQAAQEAMESIIGAVAIVFVTGMIIWMNAHSRGMKKELEHEAEEALSQGGAYALAAMAFLAVLKEGFETSVFLLATFSAAQSASLAATGAVIGVLIAVAIGWGIYAGGVRLNLAKFFRGTGAFLILVAAGLVITALRTAHEAGWINAGQQTTVNLSWLVQPGTVQSALITGVLGIPADPRLIEVIGWFAYLIPVALYVYWPASRRPKGIAVARMQFGVAAGLAVAAIVLAIAFPIPQARTPAQAPLVSEAAAAEPPIGSARVESVGSTTTAVIVSLPGEPPTSIPLTAGKSKPEEHGGIAASAWTSTRQGTPNDAPATLSLDGLRTLGGGQLPVGVNPQQDPGPFTARWLTVRTDTIWIAEGKLLDAAERATTIVTISGGGLHSPRTVTSADDGPASWTVSTAYLERTASALNGLTAARTERLLWAVELPIALGIAALLLAAAGYRTIRRQRRSRLDRQETSPIDNPIPTAPADLDPHQRSSTYAAH